MAIRKPSVGPPNQCRYGIDRCLEEERLVYLKLFDSLLPLAVTLAFLAFLGGVRNRNAITDLDRHAH